jgi:ParB-like chromosome segregation protein Spo0J
MADRTSDLSGAVGDSWTDPGRFQEIPLAAVDLEDHTFVVPLADDVERLLASIREVGLLAPPWLRPRADGRWQAVAGLKRLRAAARLGWERIPARTLPAAAPEAQCLLVALYDNAFTRGFNLGEQAAMAQRLRAYWDSPTVAAKYLPYLGLSPSPALLERLLALATLEPPFLQLAARGRLALPAGAALAGWTLEDRAAALPYLEELWLSQSMQEQLLEQLSLLARREATSPGAILGRAEVRQVLGEPSLSPQERTQRVRRLLRRWVYPRSTAAREAFQAALDRLGLSRHPRLRLTPPPAFEGPDFHLEIKFRDSQELANLLEELTRLTNKSEFGNLTSI